MDPSKGIDESSNNTRNRTEAERPSMYETRRLEQPTDVFLQPDDGNVRVWRYLDLAKLLYALERGVLVLPRLDLLKDQYEGAPTRVDRKRLAAILREAKVPEDVVDHATRQHQQLPKIMRRTLFVSSWHMNEFESEAMWQLYCGSSQGVALRTTYAALDQSVPNEPHIFMGVVGYLDYESEPLPSANALAPVMHKRRAFSHEREVRIVKWDTALLPAAMQGGEDVPLAHEISWNAESVLESVLVNPYAEPWYFEAVRASLTKFAPTLAAKLQWSQIRLDPWMNG